MSNHADNVLSGCRIDRRASIRKWCDTQSAWPGIGRKTRLSRHVRCTKSATDSIGERVSLGHVTTPPTCARGEH
jgi:hypothetical protein